MKRFRLKSHPEYGFETGRAAEDRQVILGSDGDDCLAILFDSNGSMTDLIVRSRGTTWDDANDAILTLKHELQFVEATIEVGLFDLFNRNRFIGITAMPTEYEEYLEDPSSVAPETARDYSELIAKWRQRGDYVVWWNEDYWCGPNGSIHTH